MIEIKHRFTGTVLFKAEVGRVKLAVELAVKEKADLRGADLRGANLRGADLSWADLSWADLRGANLSWANLSWANLRGADLRVADLRGANLRGANLSGANLRGADLSGANLRVANLEGGLKHATPEESIANLDKVREIVMENEERLNMGLWHDGDEWQKRTCAEEAVCGTTHCLAGWLQVCATDDKVRKLDAQLAGIVQAPVASKMFFREDDEVLEWLRDKKYVEEAKEYA